MSNWSVVTTVKADKELIELFIQHHLSQGVNHIFIYLDDPLDFDILSLNDRFDNVTFNICDDNFWSKNYEFKNLDFNGRPDGVEARQMHNVIHALKNVKTKWLACIDIDEFIYSDRSISDVLEYIPDNIFSVRVKPFEAIYKDNVPNNYDDVVKTKYFKHHTRRVDKFFWNEIYPNELIHKAGFFGHITGKCFFRTDEPLKWPGLHNFNPLDMTLKTNFIVDEFKLLHFEALTNDFFIKKTLNRINKIFNVTNLDAPSVQRIENLKKIHAEKGIDGLSSAYKKMHVLSENTLNKAMLLHTVSSIDINQKDSFKHKVLITIHKTVLVYNARTEICELIPYSAELPQHLSYVDTFFDYDQNLCFFCTKLDGKILYLYSDRKGRLVSYPYAKAMFFKLEFKDILNLQFSVQYTNDQYFSGTSKNEFKLGPKEVKSWEIFHIKDI